MTPAEQIDALAAAYFDRLHEADSSKPYREQEDWVQEKHRRAVRALLLNLKRMEIAEALTDGLLAFGVPAGPVADEVMTKLDGVLIRQIADPSILTKDQAETLKLWRAVS